MAKTAFAGIVVTMLFALSGVLLASAGSSGPGLEDSTRIRFVGRDAALPPPCPQPTPAPGDPTPTVSPSPGPTEFDVIMTFGFTNDTGQAVSDLHICMDRPIAGGSLASNAPGCSTPQLRSTFRGRDIDVVWPNACVDPGEGVSIQMAVPGAAEVYCHFWTLFGTPLSSCDGSIDKDGDGWGRAAEEHIGTSDSQRCGYYGWPADFVEGGFQPNTLNVEDLASFVTPYRRFNTSPGDQWFWYRWDLVPGTTVGKHINVADIAATVTGATGYPPMLGGQRAFGQTCP